MSAHDDVRCGHCSDRIGVYEPLVVLLDGVAVRTSRAAAAGQPLDASPCFHAECFEACDLGKEYRDP